MSEKHSDWHRALRAVVDEERQELGPHPELDEMVAYHAGDLPQSQVPRLQNHLVLCPECSRLLLELDRFAVDAGGGAARPTNAAIFPISASRRPRWRRWTVALAAVAATLLLVVWPRGAPFPEYAPPELRGALRATRSPGSVTEEIPVFAAGSRLSLKLRPETAVSGPVIARVYVRRDDRLRALSAASLEIFDDGVVSLEGIVGTEIRLSAGESELVIAAGRPRALPSRQRLDRELRSADSARGKHWVVFRQKIVVREPSADPAPPSSATGEGVAQLGGDDGGPRIEYAGCRRVLDGPICVLPNHRRLTLWARHRDCEEVGIAGSVNSSPPAIEVQGGCRFEIEIEEGTSELVVETRARDERSIWALEFVDAAVEDWLQKALAYCRDGAWDEARALLQPRASGPEPGDAGAALSLLARIEQRGGQVELRDRLYRQALAAHRQAGRLSDLIKDSAGFTYYLIEEKRWPEAFELLDTLPVAATGGSAEARYSEAFYRGLLAEETGDFRAALSWTSRAARSAERAGAGRRRYLAEDMLARQLSTVGLVDEAAALYSRMRLDELCDADADGEADAQADADAKASLLTACDCVRFAVNRAWAGLLALESGRPRTEPRPATLLAAAERALDEDQYSGCARAEDLPNVRLNRALAALHDGDLPAAQDHLERAQIDSGSSPRLALWQLDIKARIWLGRSQPQAALELYDELARRAELGAAPEAAWRAAFGRAMALESLGQTDEANDACARADVLLDRESLLIPMHAGRSAFLAGRQPAAAFCLDLLLRGDREHEALSFARRSVSRALRNLRFTARLAELAPAERDLWMQAVSSYQRRAEEIDELAERIWRGLARDEEERLTQELKGKRRELRHELDRWFAALGVGPAASAAELVPPAPGTLLLVFHPLPQGWAALAHSGDFVGAHRVKLADETLEIQLSERLLEPFAEQIRGAAEVQIVAYGALRDVDFHALPFADGSLLEEVPVTYRVDLPSGSAAVSWPSSRAVVLPGSGLLEAPAEARAVRASLESSGRWQVEFLEKDAASRRELLRRLPDTAIFHYAGHADYDENSRGWDSHLALPNGGRLSVDDVLALSRGPRWVVLSGCETGRDSDSVPLPSIGLAQAFLIVGAEAVVAATAEVSDEDAAELMAALYRHWQPPRSLAAAMRKAQLELEERSPESGWRKFRVLVRSLPTPPH